MAKYRIVSKGNIVTIKSKLSFGEQINEREINIFERQIFRGCFRPRQEGKKTIIYTAPNVIQLTSYLKREIEKEAFYQIIAQTIEMTKRIEMNGLYMCNLMLQPELVYISERTKELFFVYQPIISRVTSGNVYAFLGDITETIFCRVTAGVWMSRSSVVWGPFSIVWGLAIALVTALLYKYKDKGDRFLFLTGTLLGGAYEYFCSVFTELVFGKVFWDYSRIPFNLGGRINLLYCFFWGIAAVVWFKILFPPVEKWIEKIPAVAGKILTWVLLGFMVCNILVSCVALVRYDERGNGVQATNAVQKWADAHYDDAKMKKIYPNAKGIN